ncbi:MAG TPA: DUF6491 family protein [Alphaproteobacteria bacterium]|nr:DUF6491 family protein [Alphaproteobacteria bacterium]
MKNLVKSALLAPVMALAMAGFAQAASNTDAKIKEEPAPKGRAVINFANLPHRIDSWQADGTKGIYLRVGIKKWYHATFLSPCIDLPFVTHVGIVTDGMGQVDRFSSIVVNTTIGPQRCWFKAVDEVEGPPKKSKK